MNRLTLMVFGIIATSLIVNGQFFVDIEHSLPRLGKRFESNENMVQSVQRLANTLKYEILKNVKEMSNEEAKDYFSKVIQVMRILAKNE